VYLDPGFGGMFLQIVVVLIAAGGAILFSFRRKLRNLFSKNDPNTPTNPTTQSSGDIVDMISEDSDEDSAEN